MGQAPSVKMWVGLREDDLDLEAMASALGIEIEEDEELDLLEEIVAELGGEPVEAINAGEDDKGLGIEVFEHDWNDGISEFDIHVFKQKVNSARKKLAAIFEENGIVEPIKVWCQTDFS